MGHTKILNVPYPHPRVIESIGPTNTRKYVVAVYFRGSRLATGSGHSIQQAEMDAAEMALKKRAELFPILQVSGPRVHAR